MARRYLVLGVLAAGILALALKPSAGSEIARIKSLPSVDAQAKVLTALLDRVGPLEAQEELYHSGLPFTGQTHLLVHAIGDYVYRKYGMEGLPYCKEYFLAACYHGFILNVLADHGLEGITEVMAHCAAAGPGVLPQCAHGAGHGFEAWQDYGLVKALAMCDEAGEKFPGFPYFNCYDGVFMENFWGVHGGVPSPNRWIKEDDAFYPCDDPRIPEKYLAACWADQATIIYQHYKGDLKKTAEACDTVGNIDYRNMCYNNLARQIHPLTGGNAEKVFALCQAATGQGRQDDCVLTNMSAYYSVGDRTVPQEICEMATGQLKSRCLTELSGMMKYYGN